MKKELFKANSRGHKDHGWLDTYHTFSFASYYNPQRIHFGALRVVNDDIVVGGEGFGTHPHEDMEIVSIPLKGALEHKDSMGNGSVINVGEVQVMSAGKGITHSEFNASEDQDLNFFQIWVFPRQLGVKPRYGQQKFDFWSTKNKLTQIVSPDVNDEGLWIHQDAWFNLGVFDKDQVFDYKMKNQQDGLFIMSIEGKFEVAGEILDRRDAIGLWEIDSISIKPLSDDSRILLIEVPMYKL